MTIKLTMNYSDSIKVASSNVHTEKSQVESSNEQNSKDLSNTRTSPDLKATLISLSGNILEWYDFVVFGYFSDVIGEVFFPPNQKGSAALVESFLVYGLAFVARPIGGAILGRMGDKNGRKGALEHSILWMAFATFAIGCLPSYDRVGLLSPALLTIMRLIQGMMLGGQLVSLLLFILEQRDFSTWAYWGAVVNAFSKIGSFVGSAVTLTIRECLTDDQVKRWGWRIPFWLGALGGLPAIYLKYRVKEYYERPSMQKTGTDLDENTDSSDDCENGHVDENSHMETSKNACMDEKDPLKEVLSKVNFPSLIGATLLPSVFCGLNYLMFVWLAVFMNTIIDPPVPHAYAINTINVAFGGIILTIVAGWFADWYGNHKKLLIISSVVCGVTAPACFFLLGKGGAYEGLVAFSVQLYASILLAIFSAAMVPWLVSNTPIELRLTMVSIGMNMASLLFGGFTPLLATILASRINFIAPAYILTTASAMSLTGIYILHKRQGDSPSWMIMIDDGNVPLLR